MIEAVTTPTQQAAFGAAIQGVGYFQAVQGTALALWGNNPGAPIKLYLAGGAALTLSGRRAQLCGTPPDWEELAGFLRFAGVERLLSACPPPANWVENQRFYRYTLGPGQSLPLPPPPPAHLVLDQHPAMAPVAALIFATESAQQEYFYTVACTAINHGIGCCWALLQDGRPVATVGCYERWNGEAYMAAGETLPALRGQGLGGWLIPALANRLAGAGDRVSFLCGAERRHFYDRCGFIQNGYYIEYNTNMDGRTRQND
ncbi:MAG: GNAT family N-acetyltransferase [Gemmiger sp.]|nr:GNAT family N-acetyltransferase [Gemmiger sp.]